MFIYKYFNQKGIGIVEVIAALGIAVVVITSMVSLSLFTMRSALQSTVLLESSKYANKEVELIRAYRNQVTWQAFKDTMRSSCQTSPCSMEYVMGDGEMDLTLLNTASVENASTPQQLARSFTATVDDAHDSVRIAVLVTWQIGTQTKSTSLYTDFTNWQNR